MSMPEAAVHKNDFTTTREHEVWASRKHFAVKAITVSGVVQHLAQLELWAGILCADRPHDFRTLIWGPSIYHVPKCNTVNRFWEQFAKAVERLDRPASAPTLLELRLPPPASP